MTEAFSQPPFVGDSRHRVVDGLVDILDEMNSTGEPRWVSLEAPSGWGKTRVVQEFYARLAARQSNHYWPETILGASDVHGFEVGDRRKRVFPDPRYFVREPQSLPEFMWLGMACDLRNGLPSQTLLEDLQQLKTHAIYLEAAAAALQSVRKGLFPTLGQARTVLSEVIEAAIGEGLAFIVEEVAKASVPAIGLVVKLGRWGVDRVAESNRRASAVAASGAIQKLQDDDLVESVVDMLTRLARPGLPVIVFVEDLHRVSDMCEEFLERLVRARSAVMLITTTWPGEAASRDRLGPLLSEEGLRSRILRLQHDEDAPTGFPTGASLAALPKTALADIVLSYYPNAEPRTLERLAARYNNPLPLELVCTLPKYRRHFADGSLTLSEEEIEALPRRVEDLYRELWDELPLAAQQVMALATLAIPDNGSDWHHPITLSVIQTCDKMIDAALFVHPLDQDSLPHGWVRTVESWSRRFNEPDQLAIARQSVEEYFFEIQIDEFLAQLAAAVTKRDLAEFNAEDQHCAWLILALYKERKTNDLDALRAIRCLQQSLRVFPRELPALIELGKLLELFSISPNNIELLNARHEFYSALADSGQISKAVTHGQSLLEDQLRVLGPDHPYVLTTRNDIAVWLGQSGRFSQAIKQFTSLLKDCRRVLGPDHPDVLRTHSNFIYILGECGQAPQALRHYAVLLNRQQRLLSPNHPQTLNTHNNIAGLLAKTGQILQALTHSEALLEVQKRVMGPDHPSVLVTRHNIATWLGRAGQTSQALMQLKMLLKDQQRALGPDHPIVHTTRRHIAFWLAESGQLLNAQTQYMILLEDQERVLGPNHPDVFKVRNDIASWTAESGQVSKAITQFESLIEDQQRVLRPAHPIVLGTRSNHAYWLAISGQISKALALTKTLLKDQKLEVGPDHPYVLTTRHNIAYWMAKSGQMSKALIQFEALLKDQERILGPDHPETCSTINLINLLRSGCDLG